MARFDFSGLCTGLDGGVRGEGVGGGEGESCKMWAGVWFASTCS